MRYIYPPTISTGNVLCNVALSAFRHNDEYFNGIADGWRTIPCGVDRGFIGDELSRTIYEAYHYLRSDAKTLVYWIFADEGSSENHKTTSLYYDDVLIDSVTSTATFTSKSGTADLSAKSVGLYKVHATLEREATGLGRGGLRAPFTRYTGSKTWTTPPTITDGSASSQTHFHAWRDNDLYFKDVVHPHPACAGMSAGYIAEETSHTLWDGWDRFHPDHYRMYYSLYLSNITDGNSLRLYYDLGGTYEQYMDITTAGTSESYWTLSSPGNYTKGDYYQVRVKLRRTGSADATGEVNYLFMTAEAADASYTVMDQFAAGQYVYGNTAGQGSRLALLSANDSAIRDRLIWDDVTNARQDYAVAVPEYARLGGTDTGDYYLCRRYDLLYYRTTNAELHYFDNTQRLDDYDESEGTYYNILNLNSLDLPHGYCYYITGDALEYAMEY